MSNIRFVTIIFMYF